MCVGERESGDLKRLINEQSAVECLALGPWRSCLPTQPVITAMNYGPNEQEPSTTMDVHFVLIRDGHKRETLTQQVTEYVSASIVG